MIFPNVLKDKKKKGPKLQLRALKKSFGTIGSPTSMIFLPRLLTVCKVRGRFASREGFLPLLRHEFFWYAGGAKPIVRTSAAGRGDSGFTGWMTHLQGDPHGVLWRLLSLARGVIFADARVWWWTGSPGGSEIMVREIRKIEIGQIHLDYAHTRIEIPKESPALAASIKRLGQIVPVIVTNAFVLLDGYLRHLGRDTVMAEIWDCTEESRGDGSCMGYKKYNRIVVLMSFMPQKEEVKKRWGKIP